MLCGYGELSATLAPTVNTFPFSIILAFTTYSMGRLTLEQRKRIGRLSLKGARPTDIRSQLAKAVPPVMVSIPTILLRAKEARKAKPEWTTPSHQGRQLIVLHFCAAVSHGHKSKLYFTNPTPPYNSKKTSSGRNFNSQDFISLMGRLYPLIKSWYGGTNRFALVMDHAKQHTCKASKEALATMGVTVLEGYPAQCWDLNMIEYAWAQLDRQLIGKRPTTARVWCDAVTEA